MIAMLYFIVKGFRNRIERELQQYCEKCCLLFCELQSGTISADIYLVWSHRTVIVRVALYVIYNDKK